MTVRVQIPSYPVPGTRKLKYENKCVKFVKFVSRSQSLELSEKKKKTFISGAHFGYVYLLKPESYISKSKLVYNTTTYMPFVLSTCIFYSLQYSSFDPEAKPDVTKLTYGWTCYLKSPGK